VVRISPGAPAQHILRSSACGRSGAARRTRAGVQRPNWLAGHAVRECRDGPLPCHNDTKQPSWNRSRRAQTVRGQGVEMGLPWARQCIRPFVRFPNAFPEIACRQRDKHDERGKQPDRTYEAGAARTHPARHSLHGRRHRGVCGFERGFEMAGGKLPGRRGSLHPNVGRTSHLCAFHHPADWTRRIFARAGYPIT